MTDFEASYIAPRVVQPAPGPDDEVRTVTRTFHAQRAYPDVPGAVTAVTAELLADLRKELEPEYGERDAERLLAGVKWSRATPRFAGDTALLRADLEVTSLVTVLIPPTGHQ